MRGEPSCSSSGSRLHCIVRAMPSCRPSAATATARTGSLTRAYRRRSSAFGGPADWLTGPRLRRLIRRFAPRVVVAWMNRAARFAPQGDWVLAGRLGGYYDLSYYKRCDHLIGNTGGIVAWIRSQGWPPGRVHHLPNFADDLAGAPSAGRQSLGVPAGRAASWRSDGCTGTRRSTCWCARCRCSRASMR